MQKSSDSLTPMMRQYLEIKKEHSEMVLFFRLGDFYEMFFEDAIEVSHLLNLTLTHRGSSPMCGIPYHAAKNYLKRLLELGKKVAICEQTVIPDSSRELAKREVVQIYTPGTVIEDEYLDNNNDSFVLALHYLKGEYLLSYADITTGEFYSRCAKLDDLLSIFSSLTIKEILIEEDLYFTNKELKRLLDSQNVIISKLPLRYFSAKNTSKLICSLFSISSIELFSLKEKDPLLTTINALLLYLNEMCKTELKQFKDIKLVLDDGRLLLDESSEKNLELVKNLSDSSINNTLYSTLNKCVTCSGSRLLKMRILTPINNLSLLNERLSYTEYFVNNIDEKSRVREILRQSSDLVRLASKFDMKKSVPRHLIAVKASLAAFFSLVSSNEKYLSLLKNSIDSANELIELVKEINSAINPECTNINNDTFIINEGYDDELDRLRDIESSSTNILSEYLEKVKAETGLTILKLSDNKIIGYFLEVPKGQLSKVPAYFIRRQTLVNCERFTTQELTSLEDEIKNAQYNAKNREKELYNNIVHRVEKVTQDLRVIGHLLSELDYYQALSQVALENNYVKPTIVEEGRLILKDARHPVVESTLTYGSFVKNDFDSTTPFALITGPNMAGKSTFLRQTALIVLMAHIGSYVPCSSAIIPLTDRIFTRVGASDNLAKGESTFLVEMKESAYILRHATKKSLVIMDEIGRGTSTQDGMSIAYAIMNYLFTLGCVTLFATHYHELTMLDTSGMQLLTLQVEQEKNDISFVRKVINGVSKSSYGLHVARLAGVPQSVIKKASSFQKTHFASYSIMDDNNQLDLFVDSSSIDNESENSIVDKIMDFDISQSTPVDALLLINSLQNEIKSKIR